MSARDMGETPPPPKSCFSARVLPALFLLQGRLIGNGAEEEEGASVRVSGDASVAKLISFPLFLVQTSAFSLKQKGTLIPKTLK